MYFTGRGIVKDVVYAHMWASLSADGNKYGFEVKIHVAKLMTPAQILEAKNRARECVRKKYKEC